MDAYDVPGEFAFLKAQNMDKIGVMQDLVRGIKKLQIIKVDNQIVGVVKKMKYIPF